MFATSTTAAINARTRARDLYQEQFEKQAREYAVANEMRPALITAEEASALAAHHPNGQERRAALNALVKLRAARLEELRGEKPFDELTPIERAEADAFFVKTRQRTTAPDNPIRARDAERAAAPLAERPVPAPQSPPAERLPENIGGAVRGLVLPPPAMLKIEFVSAHGFHCELTLHAPSGTQVLEQGKAAMAKLVEQNAQPMPTPAAVIVPAAAAAAVADASGPHLCKYHGPMKPSPKAPGTWFCSSKMGDGSYCKEKWPE